MPDRAASPAPAARSSRRVVLAYAVANVGGVIAYLPLLTLLLPLKVEALRTGQTVAILSAASLAGAIAASVANIAFGWLSDRSVARGRTRRGWIAGGLVATMLGYAAIAISQTPGTIVAAVAAWQVSVNMLLAPLFAMMADDVPDDRKGVAGALLTLAQPVAAAVSALLAALTMVAERGRLAILGAIVVTLVAPVLLLRHHAPRDIALPVAPPAHGAMRVVILAWGARLLVQVAGSVLTIYLLVYFAQRMPSTPAATLAPAIGRAMALACAVAVPVAIVAGRVSDRTRRRAPFLLGAAAVAAVGLAIMAGATHWSDAIAGLVLQACGSAVFLALQSVSVMQMLPHATRRGVALGIVNLANTIPALVAPLLAWALATSGDFTTTLRVLAATTLAGGVLAVLGHRAGAR